MKNHQTELLKKFSEVFHILNEACKRDSSFNELLGDYNLFPLGLEEVIYRIDEIIKEEHEELIIQ
jgi:hypothetical protein